MCLHCVASGYFILMRDAHTLQANKAALTALAFTGIIYGTRVRVIGSVICFQQLCLPGSPLSVGNKVLLRNWEISCDKRIIATTHKKVLGVSLYGLQKY